MGEIITTITRGIKFPLKQLDKNLGSALELSFLMSRVDNSIEELWPEDWVAHCALQVFFNIV